MVDQPNIKKLSWLVLKAQLGDRASLDQLLAAVQQRLHRYISRLCGPQEADDVLQDVFLIIYRKLGWLKDPRRFTAWAYRIATHEAYRALKKQHERSDIDMRELHVGRENGQHIHVPALSADVRKQIVSDLDQLSPNLRAVLTLHYYEGQTLKDVAQILGIPIGTVKSRLAYGLDRLRATRKEYQ